MSAIHRYVTTIASGILVMLFTYMLIWFFVRNAVKSQGPDIEIGAAIAVLAGAIAVGWSAAKKQWRYARQTESKTRM